MDGIYYTDQEINSCYFTGESNLVILQNQKMVKMLYTKKFHHGSYEILTSKSDKDDLTDFDNNRRHVKEITRFAEIERGQDEKNWIKGVKR